MLSFIFGLNDFNGALKAQPNLSYAASQRSEKIMFEGRWLFYTGQFTIKLKFAISKYYL